MNDDWGMNEAFVVWLLAPYLCPSIPNIFMVLQLITCLQIGQFLQHFHTIIQIHKCLNPLPITN